ncbi:tetratricopeptide repeat protein [Bacillus sp. KH172YL63]|uniref:tetratricopeptide repeat protein n=1 Tax=Bacillus sp. KH172YL63 TaxID=2709784 RepID=UPI0013E51277|nr:tetratricopeptide repeat protein [Bacillus sp. KH172YL63]BCB02820.1 hypothetical protein KH172YL63_09530 [Bacillus sp. KH172YL63]
MSRIEEAVSLRGTGNHEASIKKWKQLIEEDPKVGYLHYQCAWTHDAMGCEREAVTYYEEAIRLGLTDLHLQGAYIGLGSTYRSLGEYGKSRSVLKEGMERFPDNNGLKVFYAMALYHLDGHKEAMEHLLTCIVDTSQDETIQPYKRAIAFYSTQLDKVWD